MDKQTAYVSELVLKRPDAVLKANLCFYCFDQSAQFCEFEKYLHPQERVYYDKLKYEKRIKSYLLGRYAAKRAVAAILGEKELANIAIRQGIFTQPVAISGGNIQVSITHCGDIAAAVAFPEEHPMGIDIEKICEDKREALERQMTRAEVDLCKEAPFSRIAWLTMLWTAKEALSKVLRTGLMTPFRIFEISRVEIETDYFLGFYKNFAQYKAMSFILGDYACSIAYPKKTEVEIDFARIKEYLGA